jgi:plastocyanin
MKKQNKTRSCCGPTTQNSDDKGIIKGALFGILPHTFCILFIILSIFGATSGAVFLRRFFIIPYFFQILVAISFFFATFSAGFYLKRNGILSIDGIKRKWKYLTIMYSTTIAINLILFYLAIPAAGNIKQKPASNVAGTNIEKKEEAQVIEMDQLGSGYRPNSFTVKKGKLVRWIIHSKSQSCAASIYSPKLGISQELNLGDNIIEFTPKDTGTFSFGCFMGMYRGSIKVEG